MMFPSHFVTVLGHERVQELEQHLSGCSAEAQALITTFPPSLVQQIDAAGISFDSPGLIDAFELGRAEGQAERRALERVSPLTQRLPGETDTAYSQRMVELLLRERSQGQLPSRDAVAAALAADMDGRLPDPWGGRRPEGLDAFAAQFARADRNGDVS